MEVTTVFFTADNLGAPRPTLNTEYIAWKTKVGSLIVSIFDKDSHIYEKFKRGDSVPADEIYYTSKFGSAHSQILGSLKAALDISLHEPHKITIGVTQLEY